MIKIYIKFEFNRSLKSFTKVIIEIDYESPSFQEIFDEISSNNIKFEKRLLIPLCMNEKYEKNKTIKNVRIDSSCT